MLKCTNNFTLKMILLSERLKAIKSKIENSESVADIGTDHGYLLLSILEDQISRGSEGNNHFANADISENPTARCSEAGSNNPTVRKLIMTDVSKGSLDKARQNFDKLNEYLDFGGNSNSLPSVEPAFRLGDGLEPLEYAEVDTIVMAGIGGHLMTEIMDWDIAKTLSFKKYILQPRNNLGELVKYLDKHQISVEEFLLVPEEKRLCEILVCATPVNPGAVANSDTKVNTNTNINTDTDTDTGDEDSRFSDIYYEFPDFLVSMAGPYTRKYLENKLSVEERIVENIKAGRKEASAETTTDETLLYRQKKIERINYLLDELKRKENS